MSIVPSAARISPAVVLFCTGLVFTILWFAGAIQAAPTSEQNKKLQAADAAINRAGVQFKSGKLKEAGESVKETQKLVSEIKEIKEFAVPLNKIVTRLKSAHSMLELEGIALPPLDLPSPDLGKTPPTKSPNDTAAKAPAAKTPAAPAAKLEPLPAKNVSFIKHVAPIFVSKCGRCHVTAMRGQFSMASFAALEKGAENLKVFTAGKADGSRLVEVIETGDMPRGGTKVTAPELAAIKTWINEGAKFDGPSKEDQIARLVPNIKPEEAPKLDIVKATGNESIKFSRDVAPLLVENCFDCHGPGRQDGGRLSLENFNGLIRGGDSGLAIAPGKPADSLLIKKLKGTAGARMPLRKKPLPDSDIAKVEKWIAEGAKFDGPDNAQSFDVLVETVRAIAATHPELSKMRVKLAERKWRLAIPDEQPKQKETKNFLILGNIGEAEIEKLADTAEQQASMVAKMFRVPEEQPLVKGRITLYAFRDRPDYSEWNKMVEQRELPPDVRGHWKYNIIDAYGCVLPSSNSQYSSTPLIAQQIAGAYVASLGRVPQWFAEGTARAVAMRVDAKDARVRQWDDLVPQVLSTAKKADGFLNNELSPEQNDILSYGFVKYLMGSSAKYNSLVTALRKGDDFEQSLVKQFGAGSKELATGWAGRAVTARVPGKKGK